METDAIHFILDKVQNEELNNQYEQYKEISNKISKLYPEYSEKEPHETNTMNKIMRWYGIKMEIVIDDIPSKIAELLLQGTNIGIIEGRKILNHKNTDPEVHAIAQEYVDMQENAIEILKKFL